MAFGAVAGSIAVLITCVQNQQLVDIGVVSFRLCSAVPRANVCPFDMPFDMHHW